MIIFRKIFNVSIFLSLSLALTFGILPFTATAAAITNITDTMSTQAPNVTADHTIVWTPASTWATTGVVTISFTVSGDFTANAASSWQTTDFALTTNVGSSVAPVAVGASPSCWGASHRSSSRCS